MVFCNFSIDKKKVKLYIPYPRPKNEFEPLLRPKPDPKTCIRFWKKLSPIRI